MSQETIGVRWSQTLDRIQTLLDEDGDWLGPQDLSYLRFLRERITRWRDLAYISSEALNRISYMEWMKGRREPWTS